MRIPTVGRSFAAASISLAVGLALVGGGAGLSGAVSAAAATKARYSLLTSTEDGGRRVVAVRLLIRCSEAEVARIAQEVAASRPGESHATARTLIKFYLPGQDPQADGWASATVNSNGAADAPAPVKVSIQGLTADDEAEFVAEAQGDRRTIVGRWLTAPPTAAGRLAIVRDGTRFVAEWRLKGGIISRDVATRTEYAGAGGGRKTWARFDIAGEGGRSLVVSPSGDLEVREKGALVARADKMIIPEAHAPQSPADLAPIVPLAAKAGLFTAVAPAVPQKLLPAAAPPDAAPPATTGAAAAPGSALAEAAPPQGSIASVPPAAVKSPPAPAGSRLRSAAADQHRKARDKAKAVSASDLISAQLIRR